MASVCNLVRVSTPVMIALDLLRNIICESNAVFERAGFDCVLMRLDVALTGVDTFGAVAVAGRG